MHSIQFWAQWVQMRVERVEFVYCPMRYACVHDTHLFRVIIVFYVILLLFFGVFILCHVIAFSSETSQTISFFLGVSKSYNEHVCIFACLASSLEVMFVSFCQLNCSFFSALWCHIHADLHGVHCAHKCFISRVYIRKIWTVIICSSRI